MDEYLTVTEVADRLKVKPKTIRNKIASGVFTEGVQYFRRKSISTLQVGRSCSMARRQ
jgi:hypothetical protein